MNLSYQRLKVLLRLHLVSLAIYLKLTWKKPWTNSPDQWFMVRTSPDSGRTVDHLYSFNLDRSRALDHWARCTPHTLSTIQRCNTAWSRKSRLILLRAKSTGPNTFSSLGMARTTRPRSCETYKFPFFISFIMSSRRLRYR